MFIIEALHEALVRGEKKWHLIKSQEPEAHGPHGLYQNLLDFFFSKLIYFFTFLNPCHLMTASVWPIILISPVTEEDNEAEKTLFFPQNLFLGF